MLEKPNLQDKQIITRLRASYGIPVTEIEFLPLGNDSIAWVYRVRTHDGQPYFLKVKQGAVYEPSLLVPRYLKDNGIEQVVAPLPTTSDRLWATVADFTMILYPFIEGQMAARKGMRDSQWVEFGQVLKRMHAMPLSTKLLRLLPRERFRPKWAGVVQEREVLRVLQAEIETSSYEDRYQKELALFWREKAAEISQIIDRAEALGKMLQERSLELVLCHADIHQFNIMLDENNKMLIVDWDEAILAPKERDLMFVAGGIGSIKDDGSAEPLFFSGYGDCDIDWQALAYYRYEWVVQDMGDYAERVFMREGVGEATKKAAVAGFISFFEPGDVVEAAYKSEERLA